MAHSIRPQPMHFHTPASACIPCVCSAGILLWIFAVPCSWCIRRSRRGSSAHFPGSCLQLCAFPETHEPRTWPWAQRIHNLLPHQLEPHESASVSAKRRLLGAVSKGNIIQQISLCLIKQCLHSSGAYQTQTANTARFRGIGKQVTNLSATFLCSKQQMELNHWLRQECLWFQLCFWDWLRLEALHTMKSHITHLLCFSKPRLNQRTTPCVGSHLYSHLDWTPISRHSGRLFSKN